jgi:hypothetical protein
MPLLADTACRRGITNIKVNGKPRNSLYFEGSGRTFYGKITTLTFDYKTVVNSTICWTLTGPNCNTLYKFANPATADQGILEYALYDHKALDPASKKTMLVSMAPECRLFTACYSRCMPC